MAERNSTKILLWGIGTFYALSAIATVISVPIMLNRPKTTESGSTTTQLPQVPESTSSEPLPSTTSSPLSATTTRATTENVSTTTKLPEKPESSFPDPTIPTSTSLTSPTTTTAKTIPTTTNFEDTIVHGSSYQMHFQSKSGEDFYMTMVQSPNDPGPPAQSSYNFLAFTNSMQTNKIFKYSGNDTTLEGLYYLWNRNIGQYWDRVEPDAKIIKTKSEQYTSVLGLFDLHFLDGGNQFRIYAPPYFNEVVYISGETEGRNCIPKKGNCYPLRIGNPENLVEDLYTFSLTAE